MADPQIYAGIGSRETPVHILTLMTNLSRQLAERNWFLRTGGARGADSAFAEGTMRRQIHLPWNGYNGLFTNDGLGHIVPTNNREAWRIAEEHHPAWHRLSESVRRFMVRNVTIILGEDLLPLERAKMVICWTPGAQGGGGTGHALRVATTFGIPRFDLAYEPDWKALDAFVDGGDHARE